MRLFDIKKDTLTEVNSTPFKLEKDIQNLVEKNCESIFNCTFIETELTIGKYRLDSLCFDEENNSFVIIEYKKGKSYSVIDQGYTYLQLLLNNKSEFILTLSQYFNKVLKVDDVDWSQSKVVFVSPSFNSYQKDSINFKNLPFELWEINRFSNGTVTFDKHTSDSKVSIDSISNSKNKNIIDSVSKEVKVSETDDHTSKSEPDMVRKWEELTQNFNELEEFELIPKPSYITLSIMGKNVCYFQFRKKSISIIIERGNIQSDGTKSKNFFDIEDPMNNTQEKSWEWKSGVKGNRYVIPITLNSDLDYLTFLIKQKLKVLVPN